MQPEALTEPPAGRWLGAVPVPWRAPLLKLALAWLVLLAAFAADWRDMALQWWDSSTYNHVLLIPPIIAWLVSLRWHQLSRLVPEGWWPGLVWFAGSGFVWLLGDFAGVSLVSQIGVVGMMQGSVLALMGPRIAAGLLFPLVYLLFLVPAGDELIPFLQTITARMTMVLLGWTNVPASIEGVFITTPAGYFEVAEACSGVKFLIAMIAYGALVANVCFRSWPRRIAFMALSLVVPILANGVRAWGTIFIAQHRGIAFAAGFDHVFYGWVFFAIVMALTMALGWKFFDRAVDDPMIDAGAIEASPFVSRLARCRIGPRLGLGTLAGVIALFLTWGGVANRLQADLPGQVVLPEIPGWRRVDYQPALRWMPLQTGADHRLLGRYADASGHVVDVAFALYAGQQEGHEAGGFGQGALPLGSKWAWTSPGPEFGGGKSDRIQAPGPTMRVAVTWYRTGDLLTGSNARLKLANIRDRLLLHAAPTSALIVSAEDGPTGNAEDSIRAFLSATGSTAGWMDRLGHTS